MLPLDMQDMSRARARDKRLTTCRVWTLALATLLIASTARAEDDSQGLKGSWHSVLETLNLRAKPAGNTPDFVKATQPDPDSLDYIATGQRHPKHELKVKSAADIEAEKKALDAAAAGQLQPVAKKPAKAAPAKDKGKAAQN